MNLTERFALFDTVSWFLILLARKSNHEMTCNECWCKGRAIVYIIHNNEIVNRRLKEEAPGNSHLTVGRGTWFILT